MATFETILDPANFRIENFTVEIFDQAPPGVTPPTTIFQDDQDWFVRVSFETHGLATGMVAGSWHLLVFAESIGPGDEEILVDPGDHIEALTPGPEPVPYTYDINVSAGTLSVAGGHGVSLYRLIVSLTYFDAAGGRGPIACFEDGVTVQIYESTP